MNDESLFAIWSSDPPVTKELVMKAMNAVLEEDRAARRKELWTSVACVVVLLLLCPLLVWTAAFGKTPLVRGGYALMAIGMVAGTIAEWLYLTWSREALPGPSDTRWQVQKAAFFLSRQLSLLRAAPLLWAPVLLGCILLVTRAYRVNNPHAAYVLGGIIAIASVVAVLAGNRKAATLAARRARMEQLLQDLG